MTVRSGHSRPSPTSTCWAGPWRASPDRRHRARAFYTLDEPDGFGRATVEVRRRGEERACAASAPAIASCVASRFPRSAATLLWTASDEVELQPLVGHGSGTGVVSGRLADGEWSFEVRDDVSVRTPDRSADESPAVSVPPVSTSLG